MLLSSCCSGVCAPEPEGADPEGGGHQPRRGHRLRGVPPARQAVATDQSVNQCSSHQLISQTSAVVAN